jgi:hypothetical protein
VDFHFPEQKKEKELVDFVALQLQRGNIVSLR